MASVKTPHTRRPSGFREAQVPEGRYNWSMVGAPTLVGSELCCCLSVVGYGALQRGRWQLAWPQGKWKGVEDFGYQMFCTFIFI